MTGSATTRAISSPRAPATGSANGSNNRTTTCTGRPDAPPWTANWYAWASARSPNWSNSPPRYNFKRGEDLLAAIGRVDLLVTAADRKGLLRDISSIFADADVDVLGVNSHSERTTDTAAMRFTVEVRDKAHLDLILAKLAQTPDVLEVRRAS